MAPNTIASEKVEQAVGILDELDIDCWLTFVRETAESGDPVLPLILGQPLTWQSALIVTRSGDRIAIVGRYEDEAIRAGGVWSDIVTYVEGISGPLLETLKKIDPNSIAVNYSEDDVKADGMSHGMYLLLQRYLAGTHYANRLISATDIVRAVRGRKTAAEIERIREAIHTAQEIFDAVASFAAPGRTEREISLFMHDQLHRRDLHPAWEEAMCPIVTTGPDSMVGHGLPSAELAVTPGHIFHLDFGVCQDEYCSDIQRSWYVKDEGEKEAPTEVQRAFQAVRGAIDAAYEALGPGVPGFEVDAAARSFFTAQGYEEYQHATGHHVGRSAHDGGGVLGPKWERYGRTPDFPLEPGNVVTLELGVENADGRGYLGLEEMALITDTGATWLTEPQTSLWTLG